MAELPIRGARRVVCAAIRAADGEVLLGIRHYSRDMHAQIAARKDGAKFTHRLDEDQGFVDQFGVFMSREARSTCAPNWMEGLRPFQRKLPFVGLIVHLHKQLD